MLSKITVLAKLAMYGQTKMGKVNIYCASANSINLLSGEDIRVWIVEYNGKIFDYAFEDIEEAVDKFLELLPKAVDLSLFPDAFELKKVNFAERRLIFKQWCEDHSRELSQIAESIGKANKLGARTIWFDVPQSEVDNYVRFFREKHYHITNQGYSHTDTVRRLTLDWNITDTDRKRLRESNQ